MRSLVLLALFASPLASGEGILPIASGEYDGSNHTTTVAMENRGPSVAVCRLYSPNLDLSIEEEIGPDKTVTLNHLLYEVTLRGVLRVDCPDSVDVVARIQETPGGREFLFDGRLFRPFTVDEALRAPARRLVEATADLALTEIDGKPMEVEAIWWNGAQRRDSKVYKIAPHTFRMVDLPDRFQMGTGRVEIDVRSGEGAIVIGRETRDPRLHAVARPALQRPQPAAIPAPAPANIVRLMHVAPFKAAPFQDPATGLIYMRDRWYDPKTGTFLTPDRAGTRDSSNLYAYCGGDPVNCTDPTGMYGIDFHYAVTEFLGLSAGLHPQYAKTAGAAAQHPDDMDMTAPVANTIRHAQNTLLAEVATARAAALVGFGLPRLATRHAAVIGPARKRASGSATMLRLFHFPQGDMNPAQVERYSQAAQRQALLGLETGDAWTMGLGLHTLQDSFSHEGEPSLGFAGHPWGRGGPASHEADATYNDVRRALSAAEVTYQYLIALGTRDPSRRVGQPRPWSSVAADLIPYLAMTSRNQKRSWMEARGVYLGDDYWRHVGVGPDDRRLVDYLDRMKPSHISIDEKYLRRLVK